MKTLPTSVVQIAQQVQRHEVSAREVVDHALARAEQLHDPWRAFIVRTPDAARRQAENVDRQVGQGKRLPLAGVPFAVKDLIDVAGLPTTCGSPAFRDSIASRNAVAVQRLMDAGAVLIGKLNMHECAFGFTGENPTFGNCLNPWDRTRITGGSSSGSAAAVALGICPFTLGSDTGGSIRLPAALCGVFGIKPTYGLVSRTGGVPLAWSLDHIGPLAKTAEDAAAVLRVLAGSDPLDETTAHADAAALSLDDVAKNIAGLRIGVPQNWFFDSLDPEVADAVTTAIDTLVSLGAKRQAVKLPLLEEVLGAHRAIIFSEAASYFQPLLPKVGARISADIRVLLEGGQFLPAVDYLQAQRLRRVVRESWREALNEIDVLATPTTPLPAVRFGEQQAALPKGPLPLVRAYLDFSLPFNVSGQPAASIPCGFTRGGLPIGLQIVGRPFADATVLRVARHYQSATNWHQRQPTV